MTELSNKDSVSARHEVEPTPAALSGQQLDQLGCETDLEQLPKGYYYSRFFVGSMMATGFGLWAAVASFVCLTVSNTPV